MKCERSAEAGSEGDPALADAARDVRKGKERVALSSGSVGAAAYALIGMAIAAAR